MKKFNLFLILAFSVTALLAGYLIMSGSNGGGGSRTGTILDKFGGGSTKKDNKKAEDNDLRPFLISDRKAVSPTNSLTKNSVIYYEKNTGKIFEYDLADRAENTISDAMIPDFISSMWSPTKEEVVSSFYSSAGSDYRHRDLSTSKISKLDPNIRSLSFSPDGNFIAYYFFDPAEDQSGKIFISQPDGEYPKKLLDTRIENLKISWPAKDRIVFRTPMDELFLLSQEGKLNKFLDSRSALEEKWSKSGNKLLFSSLPDEEQFKNPVLFIKDIQSRNETFLDIEGTASKCVWSIDDITILCALARSPSEDDLYLINTSDNSKKLVADLGIQIKEILLSSTEDYIIFISASDEKLYGIKIAD